MKDNMTDNEIIKDLETCFDIKGCAKCSHNDGLSHCVFCIRTLLKDALGLINRQRGELRKKQVKIHKLLKELNQVQDYYEISKAEIERLKSDNDILSKNMHNLCKELDAEKLKNF